MKQARWQPQDLCRLDTRYASGVTRALADYLTLATDLSDSLDEIGSGNIETGEHFMDAGAAALWGASIGFLSGPISAWVADYLRYRRTDKLDALRRARLEKILVHPNPKFREIEYLARMIGADEDMTKRLLLEIGARPLSKSGSNKWALISRAPFPEPGTEDADEREGAN